MKDVCAKTRGQWSGYLILFMTWLFLALSASCDQGTLSPGAERPSSLTAVVDASTVEPTTCQTVTLDGAQSSDPSGRPLTYQWTLTAKPAGSMAALANLTSSQTSLAPDEGGDYTVQLTVNNGTTSAETTVMLAAILGPVADPGANQAVALGTVVQLDGSGSKNPETGCTNSGLAFMWEVAASEPASATYALDDNLTINSKLHTDLKVPAVYLVSLTVTTADTISARGFVFVTTLGAQ